MNQCPNTLVWAFFPSSNERQFLLAVWGLNPGYITYFRLCGILFHLCRLPSRVCRLPSHLSRLLSRVYAGSLLGLNPLVWSTQKMSRYTLRTKNIVGYRRDKWADVLLQQVFQPWRNMRHQVERVTQLSRDRSQRGLGTRTHVGFLVPFFFNYRSLFALWLPSCIRTNKFCC